MKPPMQRYVSGQSDDGFYHGAYVAVDTDDEGEADRRAAAYAKERGWKCPRVRRRHPPGPDDDVVPVRARPVNEEPGQ